MTLLTSSGNLAGWLYGPGQTQLKICGDVFSACKFGTTVLKIPFEEIKAGLEDAALNGNNVIEFGEINGLFLFSRKEG